MRRRMLNFVGERVSASNVHQREQHIPHANKILHHKLINRLRRMRHIYLALPVSKIRFLHDVCQGSSMVQMKAIVDVLSEPHSLAWTHCSLCY